MAAKSTSSSAGGGGGGGGISGPDCVSDNSSCVAAKRQYRLTDAAKDQRQDLADRKRWFKDMSDLKYKLSLKADDSQLLSEIEANLIKVFSFKDIMGIFQEAYDVAYEQDERTLQTLEKIRELELNLSQGTNPAAAACQNMVCKEDYDQLCMEYLKRKQHIYDLEFKLGHCRSCIENWQKREKSRSEITPNVL